MFSPFPLPQEAVDDALQHRLLDVLRLNTHTHTHTHTIRDFRVIS